MSCCRQFIPKIKAQCYSQKLWKLSWAMGRQCWNFGAWEGAGALAIFSIPWSWSGTALVWQARCMAFGRPLKVPAAHISDGQTENQGYLVFPGVSHRWDMIMFTFKVMSFPEPCESAWFTAFITDTARYIISLTIWVKRDIDQQLLCFLNAITG